MASEDPAEVGGYRLRARLGAGGMGRVYLAFTAGGHPVAVKVIRPELAGNVEFRDRFRQEVASARRVHGLYTAQVVDADTEGPRPWLATAYVAGPSLAEALAAYGPMPVPTVLLLMAGVAEALQAIHAAGVVHRDLKPSNVLLAGDGPKVIDFGIARAAESTQLTATHMRVGSVQYMAPEQATGLPVTPAADVFALGALAVCAASGRAPFGEGTDPAVLYRVVNQEPDLAGCPPQLRELLGWCLAKDPAARPAPAAVLDRCRQLSGDSMQAAGPWLPPAVAAGLAEHAPAAFGFPAGYRGAPPGFPPQAGPAPTPLPTPVPATPPGGVTPPPGYQPTVTAGRAGFGPAGPGGYGPGGPGGYRPPAGPPAGYGPGGPGGYPPGGYGPAPAGRPPGRGGQVVLSRRVLTAAAAVVVVAALAAVLVAVHPWAASSRTVADPSRSPAAGTAAGTAPSPAASTAPSPAASLSPASPSTSPSVSPAACLYGTWKMTVYNVLATINGEQTQFTGTGATEIYRPNGTGEDLWQGDMVSSTVDGERWTETFNGTMTWHWAVQDDQLIFTDAKSTGTWTLRENGEYNNSGALTAEPGAVAFTCYRKSMREDFPNGAAENTRQ